MVIGPRAIGGIWQGYGQVGGTRSLLELELKVKENETFIELNRYFVGNSIGFELRYSKVFR